MVPPISITGEIKKELVEVMFLINTLMTSQVLGLALDQIKEALQALILMGQELTVVESNLATLMIPNLMIFQALIPSLMTGKMILGSTRLLAILFKTNLKRI